jgi:hypothetical protein
MDVVSSLVANREPTVLGKPGQCAFHNPSVAPQLLATLDALPSYAALDPASPQQPSALFVVVGFVSMQFVGSFPRTTFATPLDRLYTVHKLFEYRRVVDICRREHHRERDAPPVDHKVALRARFPLIRRIRSGLWAPLLAGMIAESKEARAHSI